MRRSIAIACLALAACGEEEEIIRVKPLISVCSDPEARICDQPIDLGELPIDLADPVGLYVTDRGEGALVISAIGGDVTSEVPLPLTVGAGTIVPLPIAVTPAALGSGTAILSIESDDLEHSPYRLELSYVGVPKPAPKIELCAAGSCGPEVTLDFGLVRRTQMESGIVTVKNAGTTPLSIASVEIQGTEDEIAVASSTRPGVLPANGSADVVLVYEPKDGAADRLELVFHSDDPVTPAARAIVLGTSDANGPPIAVAETDTGTTSIEVIVEDVVVLDGALSTDPEGDPLEFSWSLSGPARSAAMIDDPSAGLVTFAPDVAGEYTATLVVTDSLGQSSAAAVVTISARPRYAFRARLTWQGGGDVDLLLINPSNSICWFMNPRPAWGAELKNDVEAPPGGEEIVFEVPAAGTYRLFAYYYDDMGSGPADVTVEVVIDDASTPVFSGTMTLDQTCSQWHVGNFVAPATFNPSSDPLAVQCR